MTASITAPGKRAVRLMSCRMALGLACAAILAVCLGAAGERAPSKAPAAAEDAETQHLQRVIHDSLQQSRQGLQDLGSRLPRVDQELRQLMKDTDSVQVQKKGHESNPPPPPPTPGVRYRKPHEQLTDQKSVNFVCENGTISFIDFEEILKKVLDLAARGGGGRQAVDFDLTDSDFRIEGTLEGTDVKLTAIRKANHPGESLEEIRRPGSRFAKALAGRKSADYYVKFDVWPDSYAAFREARSIVWDRGFDAGWSPMASGEKLELSSGHGKGIKN